MMGDIGGFFDTLFIMSVSIVVVFCEIWQNVKFIASFEEELKRHLNID